MNHWRFGLWVVSLAGGALMGLWPLTSVYSVQVQDATHPMQTLLQSAHGLGYDIPELRFQGANSCSAMGCHHGPNKGEKGSEFTTWATYDPHFKAYQVLFNPESKRMVRHLKKLSLADEPKILAHQEALCLKCHSTDVPQKWQDYEPLQVERSDAVACEWCHGASEKWKTVHYQDFWKELTHKQKAEQYGLYPTKDLSFRVRMCASCHVGQPGMEVNHELIAAGHPALRFEYTSYHFHRNYTRHWKEEDNYGPDFDARAWQIGQLASVRCSMELLLARTKGEWPELAEFNCFSCHHDLQPQSWKQALPNARLGAPRWGTWYTPLLDQVGRFPGVDAVQAEMTRPNPSPSKVRNAALAAIGPLEAKLAQLQASAFADSKLRPYPPALIRQQLLALTKLPAPDGWDEAAQRYLSASSWYHAAVLRDPSYRDPAIAAQLDAAQRLLSFPLGYNSPARNDFTPERFQGTFSLIRRRLTP